jgi:hypothetical protein
LKKIAFTKKPRILILVCLSFLAYLFLAGSVDNGITAEGIGAIEKLEAQEVCRDIPGFDAEIACIGFIQRAIRKLVPDFSCPIIYTHTSVIEPKHFYDKKLLVIYGLYSRHGMFHGMNLPGPEFNQSELKYNIE